MKWIEDLIPIADRSWNANHNKLCELIKQTIPYPRYGVEIGVAFGSNSFNLLSEQDKLVIPSNPVIFKLVIRLLLHVFFLQQSL